MDNQKKIKYNLNRIQKKEGIILVSRRCTAVLERPKQTPPEENGNTVKKSKAREFLKKNAVRHKDFFDMVEYSRRFR